MVSVNIINGKSSLSYSLIGCMLKLSEMVSASVTIDKSKKNYETKPPRSVSKLRKKIVGRSENCERRWLKSRKPEIG